LYLHYVTKSNDSTFNACPSNSQQDGTYSILQASDSRQSLLDRRPCMRMLRSDTVDRRCSQGCARWYRDCHGVDLGGGVASCCLGHPCMLEVCSRVPMYSSIESILVGWLLSLPSTIVNTRGFHRSTLTVCSIPAQRIQFVYSQNTRHKNDNDTATRRKQTAPTEWHMHARTAVQRIRLLD
jgi:hypothetical protein